MLIFDAHLDLAMNAMEWNRDYRRPLEEIRAREAGRTDFADRGNGVISFAEMRRGGIGLCVATLIARHVKPSNKLNGWNSPEQAWAQTQGQLAWYRAMEEAGELSPITDLSGLNRHLGAWEAAPGAHPIGYILSLEGADSIRSPKHLERAYDQGLRAVGLSHYGPGTYAQGTDGVGGLGPDARAMLQEMSRLGLILDATHLNDESFWQVMDLYSGPVWASHQNVRALVGHNRQFSDDQIRELIRRGAVFGAPLDAWMMVPGWVRGQSTPAGMGVTLDTLVTHVDHICQLAGNADHCGIGTDLDGGFGREQTASELHTIADLARLPDIFRRRGYSEGDVTRIMHGNFLAFLRRIWR